MNVLHRAERSLPARKANGCSDPQDAVLTIGDLAREFGVSLRTLRFYEDRGLLAPYRDGTARYYSPDDRSRLALILKGKNLGFTLSEIRALLSARPADLPAPAGLALNPEQIASQIGHLERQRGEIDRAIVELRDAHRRLVETL